MTVYQATYVLLQFRPVLTFNVVDFRLPVRGGTSWTRNVLWLATFGTPLFFSAAPVNGLTVEAPDFARGSLLRSPCILDSNSFCRSKMLGKGLPRMPKATPLLSPPEVGPPLLLPINHTASTTIKPPPTPKNNDRPNIPQPHRQGLDLAPPTQQPPTPVPRLPLPRNNLPPVPPKLRPNPPPPPPRHGPRPRPRPRPRQGRVPPPRPPVLQDPRRLLGRPPRRHRHLRPPAAADPHRRLHGRQLGPRGGALGRRAGPRRRGVRAGPHAGGDEAGDTGGGGRGGGRCCGGRKLR